LPKLQGTGPDSPIAHNQMDLYSPLDPASPDFTRALDIAFPTQMSGHTPAEVRARVRSLREIGDRRAQLELGLQILHEMLYLAECPDDFLSIARLIQDVREEMLDLP
jgi:hypothetical protein